MAESMENSPVWLALVQILVVIGNAYLLARQKNRSEVEKQGVDQVKIDLGLVRQLAEAARTEATLLNTDKYEAVRAKCEELLIELRDCQAKNRALAESVTSMSNKLASREKVEKRAAKAAAEEAEEDVQQSQVGPGGLSPDVLAQLGAIPLQPQHPAPATPSTFGKTARDRS